MIDVIAGRKEIAPPSRLNPDVAADVDYILRKALRTEAEERYVSVEAFANDIRAFLESRPVSARAGNNWYRMRKFLRRHWVPVAAAALVVFSMAAGLYVANRSRVVAEQRFHQLRQLSNKVFDLDKAIKDLPGSTRARQEIVSASLEYLEGLAAHVRGDPDLALEVGQGYWRVASVQGVPAELNLGEYQKAESNLKKADDLIDTVLAARPKDRTALIRSSKIAQDRMILASDEQRYRDLAVHARKAIERADAFLRLGGASEPEQIDVAGTYGNVALAYVNAHSCAQAAPAARRSVEIAQSLQSARFRAAQSLSILANALRCQGDVELRCGLSAKLEKLGKKRLTATRRCGKSSLCLGSS